MSYDALLTRQLAGELHALFAGRPQRGVELVRDKQQLVLDVADLQLQWNLHPRSGYLGRSATRCSMNAC